MATGTAGQNAAGLQSIGTAKRANAADKALVPKDALEGKLISMTATGNAALTAFNVAHNLGAVPTAFFLEATSVAASALHTVTADATNLIVTFTAAPAAAANNITFVGIAYY